MQFWEDNYPPGFSTGFNTNKDAYFGANVTFAGRTSTKLYSVTVARYPDVGDYICNGSNDEVQINTAIDVVNAVYALTGVGGTVFIKTGKYTIEANIVPKSGVKLQGAGRTATILYGSGSQFSVIRNQATKEAPTEFIEITDMTIDGAGITPGASYSPSWKCMYIQFSNYLRLSNLWVKNAPATGIGTDYLPNCIIDNCIVENNGTSFDSLGGVVGSNGIGIGIGRYEDETCIISNCIAINNGNIGIMYEQQSSTADAERSKYMTIADCMSYGNKVGFLASGARRVSFDNCWAWGNQRNGFKVNGGGVGSSNIYHPAEVYFNGCRAFDNSTAGSHDGFLIDNDQTNIQETRSMNIKLIDCVSSGHGSNGYQIRNITKVTLDNCEGYENVAHGLLLFSNDPVTPTKRIRIRGGAYYNNATAGGSFDGIRIGSSGTGIFDNGEVRDTQCYDDHVQTFTDGAITSGTPTLTSNTALFQPEDVGKSITVNGAGVASANLTTTILAWVDSETVTLATNASTTVSGATFNYGTTTQRYGISIAGTTNTTNIRIIDNDLRNNKTSPFNTGSISTLEIRGNSGYNPVGQSSITVTASPFTYTAGNSPETVYIYAGTVSGVVKGSTTLASASPAAVKMEPNQSIVVTYSSAPTMVKDVQ